MTSPRIAVVVPTYGHLNFARWAVDSLVENTEDFVIILVDDGSKEWADENWEDWPLGVMRRHHFNKNGGLTRSWNYGLRQARDIGAEFTVCTNSDVLFTKNWFPPLAWALNNGAHLAGPLTNAPGHKPRQQIKRYIPDYKITDERQYLNQMAARVLEKYGKKNFMRASINGFCMAARTETWWQNPFSDTEVFNPRKRTSGNEDELQKRWSKMNRILAIVPGSFVFHYRGVTRPGGKNGKAAEGWFRPKKG